MTAEMRTLLERAAGGDRSAEAQLIEDNSGLIWSIARRYYGRGAEPDDLYQLACVGFIKAVRGFDPSLGNEFSTYAVPKIAGEIRRFLRDDGAVKVSRAVKERSVRLRRVQSELESKTGRSPTVSELAAAAGLTAEEVGARGPGGGAGGGLRAGAVRGGRGGGPGGGARRGGHQAGAPPPGRGVGPARRADRGRGCGLRAGGRSGGLLRA